MNHEAGRDPGLRSIARGMRSVCFGVAAVVGLLLLIGAPDSPGHMERVGGAILMVLGVAPFLLGPTKAHDVLRGREWPEEGRPPGQPHAPADQEAAADGGRKEGPSDGLLQ